MKAKGRMVIDELDTHKPLRIYSTRIHFTLRFLFKKKIKIYLVGALDARSAFYQQFRIGDDRDDYLYIGVILQKKNNNKI